MLFTIKMKTFPSLPQHSITKSTTKIFTQLYLEDYPQKLSRALTYNVFCKISENENSSRVTDVVKGLPLTLACVRLENSIL